ncbi:MAG: SdpI family protein [Treponema sp.]
MKEKNLKENTSNENKTSDLNKGFPFWLKIALTCLVAVQTVALLLAIQKMPESIPVHFNYKFEIDRYGSPLYILFMEITVLVVCVCGFFIPIKTKSNKKSILISHLTIAVISIWLSVIIWGLVALAFQEELIQGSIAKKVFPVVFSIPLGIFAIFYGNYAAIIPRNATLGFKTGYALSSDDAWRNVQRVGGFCFVAAGIILTTLGIISLCTDKTLLNIVGLFIFLAISVVIPFTYSFVKGNKKS